MYVYNKWLRQAGAELCQAQINFQLAMKPSRIWDSNEVMIVSVEKELKKITEKIDVKMH